ncbi:MAG: enoyl-CoA hydratase/isomerase family protein [Chloroflexi bacterium]|nr:enoyl-CoA hydratase/isomerase family protein [Chloroflexota bacterium]MYG90556.1 enoyl-CoA hydratase/isomerase family protein [Chloroflexota bacterium]MYJ93591.1 enoyl-CoA hydratase/isomerase family protein [Chloroflexota bacterium]
MTQPFVDYDKPLNGVASISLNRPEALNAINMAMRDDLWTFIQAARLDPDVRVLIFRGEGPRAFSAGADISEFGSAPSLHESREARRQRDLWALLEDLPIPTIAALHGFCFGAGIELPLYCDLRIATENTQIGLPEVTLGYIPSAGGTQLMPRIAPPGAASGLILSGDPIDADQALRWGIIHRVVAPEELDDTVLAVAERLAVADPAVTAALKRSIRRGLDLSMSAAIRRDTQTARRLANRLSDR